MDVRESESEVKVRVEVGIDERERKVRVYRVDAFRLSMSELFE